MLECVINKTYIYEYCFKNFRNCVSFKAICDIVKAFFLIKHEITSFRIISILFYSLIFFIALVLICHLNYVATNANSISACALTCAASVKTLLYYQKL